MGSYVLQLAIGREQQGATFTEDVSLPIDFAVHVMVQDGLRVPHFSAHEEGDAGLRSLGLTPTAWTAWLESLVALERTIAKAASEVGTPIQGAAIRRLAELMEERDRPWERAGAGTRLRRALQERWIRYIEEATAWRDRYMMRRVNDRFAPRHQRWLFRQLANLQGPPRLQVFTVRYAAPVVLPVPPETCIVAQVGDDGEGREFARLVAEGARILAGVPVVVGHT